MADKTKREDMSIYDILSLILSAGILVFLPWRLFRLVRLKQRDNRHFLVFWVWPSLFAVYVNAVPIWGTWSWLYRATLILITAALLLDFAYYFALKSEQGRKQLLSGLLVIPFLLMSGRHLLPADPVTLVVPFYGKALVWTDRVLDPGTWYFMEPTTRETENLENAYDDPNYGEAVFSPLTGVIVAVEDNALVLEGEDVVVRLSPILKGSHQLQAGTPVRIDQPLGLLDSGARPPGLRMAVTTDRPVRFGDVFAGRWWAGRYDRAVLKRNQYVQTDSETRFRVEAITQ